MSFVAAKNIPFFTTLIRSKTADYSAFSKLRLTVLVVFSALFGYLIGAETISWFEILALCTGGFLVTAASNGANQIIEREYDKLMERTMNRPLVTGQMSVREAYAFVVISGLAGVLILWLALNPLSGILGFMAFFSYVFLYTPMKRISPVSVLIGAFPGAIPPMLGWVAANGYFHLEAGILFAIQFIWQFPHFWAIAWVADKDYRKAGFRMLPSRAGKDRFTAFLVLIYTLILLPVSMLPVMFHFAGMGAALFLLILGVLFLLPAIRLFRTLSEGAARQVMFGSFIYLPLMLIALLIDKL